MIVFFEGQVVIVIGGVCGIGCGIVLMFVGVGVDILLVDLFDDVFDVIVCEVCVFGCCVVIVKVDVMQVV